MLSSVVFQKTSLRSLGWNTGHSGFSEPGCHIMRVAGVFEDSTFDAFASFVVIWFSEGKSTAMLPSTSH